MIVGAVIVVSAAYLFSGHSSPSPSTTTVAAPAPGGMTQAQADAVAVKAGCPASTSTRVNTLQWKSAPAMTINPSATYYAHIVTTAGTFVAKLDASTAPVTVNNFVFLAEHKFYNCVVFHRAIPGFMIQTGDPTGTGSGGPGYTIADEFPKAGSPTYPLYSLAMANTGAAHSGGSQFFVVTGSSGEALPPKYSLFGQVVSGFKAVRTINAAGNPSSSSNGVPPVVTHRMLSVTITHS